MEKQHLAKDGSKPEKVNIPNKINERYLKYNKCGAKNLRELETELLLIRKKLNDREMRLDLLEKIVSDESNLSIYSLYN